MAVDGHIDIKAIFNKNRLTDVTHDGKAVVEAHAEFEAAMCEAFGIQNGLSISGSIFGTVASDGSWSLARFSRNVPASNAANAVGWEFRNPSRAVRFVQVDGTMQVWNEQSDGSWEQVRDLEFLEDGALMDLEDVQISSIPDPDDTESTTVMVVGNAESQGFGLGEDTTTSGATQFKDLTDVVTLIVSPSYIGEPGSVLESYDDGGTDRIKAKLIPALIDDGLPTLGFFMGSLEMEAFTPTAPPVWMPARADISTGLFNQMALDGSGRVLFSESGVYLVTFVWRMNSGSTENARVDDGEVGPSAMGLYLNPRSLNPVPPQTAYPEVPWSLEPVLWGGVAPNEDWNYSWPLYTGKVTDGYTLVVISNGGDATLNPQWAHNLAGGTRQFDVFIQIERLT